MIYIVIWLRTCIESAQKCLTRERTHTLHDIIGKSYHNQQIGLWSNNNNILSYHHIESLSWLKLGLTSAVHKSTQHCC